MIELKDITKKYNNFEAVANLTLQINTGEFFGLLGPNGAGKTTTIGMLSTLLLPTSGQIYIDGELLTRNNKAIKKKVSVVTQEYSMRQDMTLDEIMEFQGRLYYMSKKRIVEKTDELFTFADLSEHRKKNVRQLSGGMKRKLMICRALLTEPEILLLDEPTAGMDALARRQMWNLLRQLNNDNLTIILTTHYMEEAEMLCDRVAFLNKGKMEELASPKQLIDNLGEYAVDITQDGAMKTYFFNTKEEALSCIAECSQKCGLRETTLEDVFVEKNK